MTQQFHQQAQQGIWTVLGPPTSCALQLAQPLGVTYDDGTTDTLPAHTPAVTAAGATQVDRTTATWIAYTTKGSAVLSVCKESALGALGGDYAPLARLLSDRVQPYQPAHALAASGTTLVALLSSVAARAHSLWTGSANAAPPANWQTPAFDDSGWSAAVAATYTAGAGYASVPGIVPIWATASAASSSEQCLLRQHFSLPAGLLAGATLVIEADDYLRAVYINGAALVPAGSRDAWPQTLVVPPGALNPGADNVLAVEGQNDSGNASVDYQLSVTYAGSASSTAPSPSTSPSAPLGALGLVDPTTQEGDLIYRHATGTGALLIGFIGDSITAGIVGGGATPTPTIAANDLASATGRSVSVSNQGINGTTSADWLPGGTNYTAAVAAFAAAGVSIVHVVLGTNDAKVASIVSAADYRTHMSAIAQALAAAGYTVVLSSQPYIVPGALAQWDATSDTQLLAYQGILGGIANGTTIRLGDTQAYSYFLAHQSELADGVHPSATGKTALGQLWANGLLGVVTSLQRLAVGASGAVLTSNGADPYWATPSTGTTSPLTTKGDVWGFSSVDARVPVGADGAALLADSTQTLGVRWGAPQPSSLLLLVPSPYNFVDSSATDNGQPPDFVMTASGDVIAVGGG